MVLSSEWTISDPIYHLVVIVPMRVLWWTLGSVLADWRMSVPWIPYLSLSGPVTLLPLGHLRGKLGTTGNLPSHRSIRSGSHHGWRITVRSEWPMIIMGRRWRCILQPLVMIKPLVVWSWCTKPRLLSWIITSSNRMVEWTMTIFRLFCFRLIIFGLVIFELIIFELVIFELIFFRLVNFGLVRHWWMWSFSVWCWR